MRRYSTTASATNTTSTTVPMYTIVGAATTRLRIYDHLVQSLSTPADNYAEFCFRRVSARGTSSTSWTPTALDPADPASLAVSDLTWSGNPTITASSDLLNHAI